MSLKTAIAVFALCLMNFVYATGSSNETYSRLEWIESNGGQYINTGIKASSGLDITLDIRLLSADPNQAIFGAAAESDSANNALYFENRDTTDDVVNTWNNYKFFYGGASAEGTIGTFYSGNTVAERKTYKFVSNVFTFKGSSDATLTVEYTTPFTSQKDIYLCWMNGASDSFIKTAAMIYGFKIVGSNGTTVLDLVPAIRESDKVAGMLDNITGAFFASSTENPFRAGPRVSAVMQAGSFVKGYRTELTVEGYAGGAEVQTNFPVLVRVSSDTISGFSYDECHASGADVFFSTDKSGRNRLACDIESWDTSGTSLVWVKLPELSGTDTKFYMFWGSGSVVDRPASTDTWSEYVAVWHMSEYDNEIGVYDETGHGYNAKAASTPSVVSSPFAGKAIKSNGAIKAPNYDDYMTRDINEMPETLTYSAWLHTDASNSKFFSRKYVIGYDGTDNRYGFCVYGRSYLETYFWNGESGGNGRWTAIRAKEVNVQNAWLHACFVSDDRTARNYINGAKKGHITTSSEGNSFTKDNSGYKETSSFLRTLGKYKADLTILAESSQYIDELRITRLPRSEAWIKAEYDSMKNSSFVVAGETVPFLGFRLIVR